MIFILRPGEIVTILTKKVAKMRETRCYKLCMPMFYFNNGPNSCKRFKTVNRWNIIRVLYECLYQKCLDFGGFSVDYGREGIAKKACSPVAA